MDNQISVDEIDVTCGTHVTEKKTINNFVGMCERKRLGECLDVGGR